MYNKSVSKPLFDTISELMTFNLYEDRITSLSKSLTPLCNFQTANITQKNNFKVVDTDLDKMGWFNIREAWKKKVISFAKKNDIHFEETSNQRKSRGFRL